MFLLSYDSCCSFVNNFIFFFLKLIILISGFLKDSQNVFIQSFPQYTWCLFSMLPKPDGIYLLTFVVDEFLGLILHPSIFSIIHSNLCK